MSRVPPRHVGKRCQRHCCSKIIQYCLIALFEIKDLRRNVLFAMRGERAPNSEFPGTLQFRPADSHAIYRCAISMRRFYRVSPPEKRPDCTSLETQPGFHAARALDESFTPKINFYSSDPLAADVTKNTLRSVQIAPAIKS